MKFRHPPGVDGNLSEAFSTKPDADEPWRYTCPNCGNQPRKQGIDSYACRNCDETFSKDELKDLKGENEPRFTRPG